MNKTTHPLHAPRRALFGAVAFASIATICVTAQEPQKPAMSGGAVLQQDANPTGSYTSTDRMIGAKVKLSPDVEAKNEAARKGEKADAPTATASDWLVDAHDGSVQYAVVSIGGFLGMGEKTVLVPTGDLRWNEATEQFHLDWTTQQLESRTPFDLSKACETGLDVAAKATASAMPGSTENGAKKGSSGTADASAKPMGKVKGTQFVVTNGRLCKASELSALPVNAGNDAFGKVSDLIVDRGQHRIVLAVVDHGTTLGVGGTSYLIPFAKLTPCTKDGAAGTMPELLCAANATKDELQKSVVYEKPKNGAVDPAAAKKALTMADRRE